MSYVPNGYKSAFPNGSLTSDDRAVFPDTNQPERGIPRPHKKNVGNKTSQVDDSACPIIVHCHLRWDWVWQRPQQFVSRLSRRHKVLFVETLPPDGQLVTPTARFRAVEDCPNLTILSVQFPAWCWADGD